MSIIIIHISQSQVAELQDVIEGVGASVLVEPGTAAAIRAYILK